MKKNKVLSTFPLVLILASCGGSDEEASSPIEATNHTPVLTAINSQTTFFKTDKIIALNANDVDGDVLTYSGTSSDSNVILSWINTNLIISPSNDFHGTANITVTVSDGSLTDSSSFTINVLQTSIPPAPLFQGDPSITPPTVTSLLKRNL